MSRSKYFRPTMSPSRILLACLRAMLYTCANRHQSARAKVEIAQESCEDILAQIPCRTGLKVSPDREKQKNVPGCRSVILASRPLRARIPYDMLSVFANLLNRPEATHYEPRS